MIGISDSEALTLLMVLNAVGVPGRLIPAWVADRWFGSFNTMLPFVAGCSILLFSWMLVGSAGGFYAWVAIYGICANAVQTLFPSATAALVTNPAQTGQRIGMIFSVGSLACLTGPPLAGVLIAVDDGGYEYMQIYGGAAVMLGLVFLCISRCIQIRGNRSRE